MTVDGTFTNIKTVEEIDFKMKNFLHHLEYEKSGLQINDIKKMIKEKELFIIITSIKKNINGQIVQN